ncbi:hypothetical protein N1851_024591 [Merluccius polli]|uniref:Uncharacterized protein n=1 Tax=Merluccius polli TaxID=89951 RepID=A0AA47MEQ7_MERPO|nr:hypothetical protein N1851_024591 [Merluccius polli]
MSVLPLKKLRRNSRYLFGLILVVGVVAVVHEFVAANTWSNRSRECCHKRRPLEKECIGWGGKYSDIMQS